MTRARKGAITDAVEILHGRYFRGRPKMERLLEEARERLRVASRLYELRERAGITQAELAERAGTQRTVITRLENPAYERHTISTLKKVAGALGYCVRIDFVPLAPGGNTRHRGRPRASRSRQSK